MLYDFLAFALALFRTNNWTFPVAPSTCGSTARRMAHSGHGHRSGYNFRPISDIVDVSTGKQRACMSTQHIRCGCQVNREVSNWIQSGCQLPNPTTSDISVHRPLSYHRKRLPMTGWRFSWREANVRSYHSYFDLGLNVSSASYTIPHVGQGLFEPTLCMWARLE